jgi:hypothetical protein
MELEPSSSPLRSVPKPLCRQAWNRGPLLRNNTCKPCSQSSPVQAMAEPKTEVNVARAQLSAAIASRIPPFTAKKKGTEKTRRVKTKVEAA